MANTERPVYFAEYREQFPVMADIHEKVGDTYIHDRFLVDGTEDVAPYHLEVGHAPTDKSGSRYTFYVRPRDDEETDLVGDPLRVFQICMFTKDFASLSVAMSVNMPALTAQQRADYVNFQFESGVSIPNAHDLLLFETIFDALAERLQIDA